MMSARRLKLEWAILLVFVIAGALASQASDLTGRIDNQLLDAGAVLARPPVDREIVIVPIDDRSLQELGTWPWPRRIHARLVEQLTKEGARLVVLDILFPDPSAAEDDQALSNAITANGAVFLPHSFVTRANARIGVDPLLPLPTLHEASAGVGHVVAEPDSDGVLRRFDLTLTTETGSYSHLALKVLKALDGNEGMTSIQGDTAIIPFHPEERFAHQPASQVLAGSTLPGFFEGKVVLVGATAQGLGDRYSVPAGPVEIMSGIGTQANLLSALRHGSVIQPTSYLVQGFVTASMILALFLAFWFLPPRYGLICAVAGALVVVFVSMALLAGLRLWFEPGSLIAALILAYPLWSWRRLTHVSRYLDREASRLMTHQEWTGTGKGLDYVTSQVEQLRGLISTVSGSLSFLQQVIEAAPDAIVVLDRDGRVDTLNKKALRLFPEGATSGAVDLDALFSMAGASLREDGAELATASGGTYLVARASISNEAGDGPTGEIIALRDVSELRQLDNERQQMLEFLSHDMRTPQVAIVGLTSQPGELKERPDIIARIRAQAERTLKLADDFVQLARLERTSLTPTETDIGALIEEACDRAYSPAKAKNIAIAQTLPENPFFATVDASLIARLLDNLISNAIKFSPEAARVSVSLIAHGSDHFILEVSDEGPGLSDERLADPFARFGAHQTHAGPSSGLGLALVKKVVDAHSGEITLRSARDEGTTFTITLPL